MKSNYTKTGTALIVIGILFLIYAPLGNIVALPGYLRFIERGGKSAAGNSLDAAVIIGAVKTILWMMAYQLGVIAVVLGAMLRSGLKKWHLLILSSAGIAYIGFSSIPDLNGAFIGFYALGGCLILIFFTLSVFYFEKIRKNCSEEKKRALDFRILGILFYGFTAWHVCGLGSVGHIMDPSLMIDHNSSSVVQTLLFKIMVEFVLAGGFTFLSFKADSRG